eukprot:s635_g28.t1
MLSLLPEFFGSDTGSLQNGQRAIAASQSRTPQWGCAKFGVLSGSPSRKHSAAHSDQAALTKHVNFVGPVTPTYVPPPRWQGTFATLPSRPPESEAGQLAWAVKHLKVEKVRSILERWPHGAALIDDENNTLFHLAAANPGRAAEQPEGAGEAFLLRDASETFREVIAGLRESGSANRSLQMLAICLRVATVVLNRAKMVGRTRYPSRVNCSLDGSSQNRTDCPPARLLQAPAGKFTSQLASHLASLAAMALRSCLPFQSPAEQPAWTSRASNPHFQGAAVAEAQPLALRRHAWLGLGFGLSALGLKRCGVHGARSTRPPSRCSRIATRGSAGEIEEEEELIEGWVVKYRSNPDRTERRERLGLAVVAQASKRKMLQPLCTWEDGERTFVVDIRRSAKRGSYDKVVVNEILDAALVAHVAYVDGDGQAKVSPMIFGREGESLYLHGHVSAGALRNGSIDVCFCVTLEDGLVLARANMHSSMNYRCVVVHGQAADMSEEDSKRHGLDVITDHMCQGQAARARPMTSAEVASTRVFRLKLEDGKVSAKIRAEGVNDDKEDIEQLKHIWAGVIPITRVYGPPENNHDSSAAPPPIVVNYPKFRSGKFGNCGFDWNSTSVAVVGAAAIVAAGVGFVLGEEAEPFPVDDRVVYILDDVCISHRQLPRPENPHGEETEDTFLVGELEDLDDVEIVIRPEREPPSM